MLTPRPPATVRASDADRERVAEILRRETGDGRLTPEELSARLDGAFAARTLGDLQALISDLPEGNVDPMAEFMAGVMKTGMRAARIGVIAGVGATIAGVAVPLLIGLAIAFGGIGAAIGAGLLVVFMLLAGAWLRRRGS
jgi:uncharacterized protein DUF1707